MQAYNVSTIAKLLNLSERRVQQLSKDGVIPSPEKGKYDLVRSVQGYVKYMQGLISGRNLTIDSVSEKARLIKNQADRTEIELQVLRSKYIPADQTALAWSDLVLSFRAHMLAIPAKLALICSRHNSAAKVEHILQEEIHDALSSLSKYVPNIPTNIPKISEQGQVLVEAGEQAKQQLDK